MLERKGKVVLVREDEAPQEISALYGQLMAALGVPHVNVIFQAYAAIPGYLRVVWKAFEPAFKSARFFELADRLRGEAYTLAYNYFPVPDFCGQLDDLHFSQGAKRELTEVVELFQYNNPPLMLLCAAQLAASEQPVAGNGAGNDKASGPPRHPDFPVRPVLVEERSAPTSTRKIYDEMKRTMNTSVVNTDYRAFARWPDFLQAYWTFLRPTLQSPLYLDHQNELRESAAALIREFPVALDFTAERLSSEGLSEAEIANAVRINEIFEVILSRLLLNVAIAKVGVEGGTIRPVDGAKPDEQAA